MPIDTTEMFVSAYLNDDLAAEVADALKSVYAIAKNNVPTQVPPSLYNTFTRRVADIVESSIGLDITPNNPLCKTSYIAKLVLTAPFGDALFLPGLAQKGQSDLPTFNTGEYAIVTTTDPKTKHFVAIVVALDATSFSGLQSLEKTGITKYGTVYIPITENNEFVSVNDLINTIYTQAITMVLSEITSEQDTFEEDAETPKSQEIKLSPANIYPGKLSSMHIDHSFVTKSLQGIEDIANNPDLNGIYTLTPKTKGSPYSKVEFIAVPGQCQRFLENKEANYLYAIKVGTTIYRLLKQPEAIASVQQGRVWLSVSTIIKGMTQTKEGHNSKAHRNENTRKKVNDAISMLATGQIIAYGPKGEKLFSSYILVANYCSEIIDNGGNVIKDVWGFPSDMSGLFKYTDSMTRNHELLDHAAFRDNEIWMSQYIGNIISELRYALYPSRGKKPELYTIKRNWDEIYQLADPTSSGAPRPKVKERIAKDLEDMLISFSKQEANLSEKKMYLSAHTEYDRSRGAGKGKRTMLVVSATREPSIQIIEI